MITPSILEQAFARTRMGERAKAVVRMVLLDGLSISEAARRSGVSREFVRSKLARTRRALIDTQGIPPGWEVVTVVVPGDSARLIYDMEAEAVKRYHKELEKIT